jgi:hypothetical protein
MTDFRYIKKDETKYWETSLRQKFSISKITAVYVFDAEEHTYCCELTPSHYLVFCGYEYDSTRELTDDEKEELDNLFTENGGDDNNYYQHSSGLKDCPKVSQPCETIDEVVEYYQANPW